MSLRPGWQGTCRAGTSGAAQIRPKSRCKSEHELLCPFPRRYRNRGHNDVSCKGLGLWAGTCSLTPPATAACLLLQGPSNRLTPQVPGIDILTASE